MTGRTAGGSAAEEAAKLLGAVADWAREHGGDLGAGVGGLADRPRRAAHDVDAHLATRRGVPLLPGLPDRAAVRSASPEVREHLRRRPRRWPQAAAAAARDRRSPTAGARGVEHIDLDRRVARRRPDDPTRTRREPDLRRRRRRHQDPRRRGRRGRHGRRGAARGLARHRRRRRSRTRSPGWSPSCAAATRSRPSASAPPATSTSRASVVMFAPNLAWRDLDLRAELEARVGLPVVVENDANAAAWGEFRFGAGEDVDDLLLVTVGTGVGGGVVLDGQLHRGAFGVGGEIGHMRVVPDGILCGCGNRGCLEPYGSGSALVREARAAARAAARCSPATLLDRAGGDAVRDHRPAGHRVRAGRRPVRRRAAGGPGPLARRGHRLAGRRARPRGRGRRRRRQRGRRPAARPDPRGVRARSSPAAATARSPRSARPALGNRAGLIGAADLARQR